MSIQDDIGVHFGISNHQQAFRLLELPPALLNLLTSEQPPILQLKSTVPTTSIITSSAASHAVLCTSEYTFQIRQVQSSNSIYIINPSQRSFPENDQFLFPSVSAIAECKATLELIPSLPEAILYLTQILNLFNDPQADISRDSGDQEKESKSKLALLLDAPFSAGQFNHAWSSLCAFEVEGRAWLPSPVALLGLWKSFTSAATVQSINFEAFRIANIITLLEEDGYPRPLVDAMILRVGPDGQDLLSISSMVAISQEQAVPWVGGVLLDSHPEDIAAALFVQQWQDLLPDIWKQQATLKALKGQYSESKDGTILSKYASPVTLTPGVSMPTKGTSKGARKWHEKFRNTRQ